jgi:type II restriction enzyme
MPTKHQILGSIGEGCVVKACACPRCKRSKTLRRLPPNFKCADVICDFCGFLAQVKSVTSSDLTKIPATVLGAAWSVQKARMDAGIYFPLFLLLVCGRKSTIYYLSADVQKPEMFKPRKPLSANARRAGWQGFLYLLKNVEASFVRIF